MRVARGRTLTPWLATYGWSKTDVARVRKGHIPGWEKLVPVAEREGVSLSWLVSSIGPQFVGQGGWIAREEPQDPIRKGPRAELVGIIDALPDDAVKSLLEVAKRIK